MVLIESGGDNLTLTFSPALVDFFIYVIDVAAGDKIPRKNGPGISQSDILVINKTDLAPYVGASLEVMDRDSTLMRGEQAVRLHQLQDGRRHRRRLVDLISHGRALRRSGVESTRDTTVPTSQCSASHPGTRSVP